MYYELYADVLFLVNFMMDYLLLLLVRKMLKCSATHRSICLGAATGSAMTCIVVVVPIPYAVLKFILFHMLVNTVMIKVGLKIKHRNEFVRAFIMLYIGGFLLGGVMEYLRQYLKIGSLFFALAVTGYYVVLGIWDFTASLQRQNQYKCRVDLYMDGRTYRVEGMIDTGNGLRDPVTNKPVSILDQKTAKAFLGNVKLRGVRYVPYHSIGKKEGVLPAVKIDRMCVHREEDCWIQEPLIGISEEEISAGRTCTMILNPDLF